MRTTVGFNQPDFISCVYVDVVGGGGGTLGGKAGINAISGRVVIQQILTHLHLLTFIHTIFPCLQCPPPLSVKTILNL